MKLFYIITLLFFTLHADAQRYILVDRKLKQPAQLVDEVSQDQLNKGFFPIERSALDSVVSKLETIRQRLLIVGREKYDEFIWKAGATTLHCTVVKWTYGDRLNVSLSTDVGGSGSPSYYIVTARKMNKENAAYLKKLLEYIQH